MSHARTQIVDAVAAMLTGLNTTGSRVCKTRVYSRDESELPSVSVFFDGEESQAVTLKGNALVRRIASLQIIGHAMKTDEIEQTLDQIAAEIEVAMSQNIAVGSTNVSAFLASTSIDTSATELQVGEVSLTYRVMYATTENDPTTLL